LRSDEVERYLRDTAGVEGWFFPVDAHLFGIVDELQKRQGVRGNLFEIGVHHGKTALFLARMAAEGELLGVCDVFGDQALNVDRSGEGSRELFERNIGDFPVRIFQKRSAELTAEETTRGCRFFHIDGGHRPEDVMADMRTAVDALLPNGVIAVDDVFNPSWPGVSEGFYAFMREQRELVPVLIGGNKVFLARGEAAAMYEVRELAVAGFVLQRKGWLGREVACAARTTWVDLDPMGAARAHLGQP
jgi:hypothetical protein